MTPSEAAKAWGFKSLKAVSRLGGESQQTLINWARNYPERFHIYLAGVAVLHPNEVKRK